MPALLDGHFYAFLMRYVFVPRGAPEDPWIFVLTSTGTAAALFAIVLVIVEVMRKREDGQMRAVLALIAAFFVLRGGTQMLSIWTVWHPQYQLGLELRMVTALLGVASAGVLIWLLPIYHRIPSIGDLRREIEERRLAEEEIREQEERFRSLLESAPDAMVISGSDGRIELTNLQAEKLFGYTRAEMIGQPVDILIPENLRAGYAKDSHEFSRGPVQRGMGEDADLRARRRDGSEIPVEISFSPLEGPKGVSLTAAIRDITDRKKSEMRFRMLLESAPDAMVIVDAQGRILLANLQTEKLFGYSRVDMVGQSVDILVPQNLQGAHREHRRNFFECPKQREMGAGFDLMAMRRDGSQFPVEISLSPLEGLEGASVTAAIRDITERRLAARELAEKIVQLSQSNEALEQFAHIASHDLQEPLRMVASYTQLLARRYKGRLDADADEFIGYAVDGTQRMKRLIEDLLLYSRAGRSASEAYRFRCEEALQEAIANLRTAIDESNARITWKPLPMLCAASSQLAQLFQNLIGNAIKYRGESTPEIHISVEHGAGEWEFSVSDNGIGIDPKYFDRIFVIFQRLHAREEHPGTGIGLAICKRILQQQGGRIWVESELGHGSVFHFTLPER